MDQVKIFDTTLRDGEQSPGCSMNMSEKIKMALQLEKLGVDIIEAGFPIASEDDFKAVQAIAKKIKKSTVCGLARALPKDIERCWEAVRDASSSRIHTFVSTSEIHLKYQMKKTPDEVLEMAKKAVNLARSLCENVEFSAMDASRTDLDYLCQVIKVAIAEGATTINIPDSVGWSMPHQFGKFIAEIIKRIPHFQKDVILSVHCHNDLGVATANSLAAVLNGARQIECAINGLGERGGNAALEEVVMGIKVRPDLFNNVETKINTKEIYKTSRLLSKITGVYVQPNKAIVGANAFAHESGIHQDAILKKRETFEIMAAENVGWPTNKLVLGKHSGRHALEDRLRGLGYELEKDELDLIFSRFKDLADKKKEIFDEDLEAIVNDEYAISTEKYTLDEVSVSCGTKGTPHSEVVLIVDGEKITATADGTGPVDAAYQAIDKIVKIDTELLEFSLNAVTEGIDAQAGVMVRLKSVKDNCIYTGRGAHTDIVVGSAKAYLHALNKIINRKDANKGLCKAFSGYEKM